MEPKISVAMIGVRNMGRAVRFYQKTIGLPLQFKTAAYSEFRTRGAVLALERRKRVIATGPSFAITTRNGRREFARLKRRGVRFWKPLREEPFGLVFMPRDSEGNIFEVVQYKK